MEHIKIIEERRLIIKNNWNKLDEFSQENAHPCKYLLPRYIYLLNQYIDLIELNNCYKLNNYKKLYNWNKFNEFKKLFGIYTISLNVLNKK